jgi:GMP synthase (glutamine-hydrolysing)
MHRSKRFLIPDGYPPESREQFERVGMRLAGVLYRDLLLKYMPNAVTRIWYSSDPGAEPITDEELQTYDGVLWPGCNLTVYHDDDPRVRAHRDLCRRAFEMGIPQFGSCWAIQLATVVCGGEVGPHPGGREMGVNPKVRLTETARRHPMYKDKPEVFSHLMSHDDEVKRLPEGATLLAYNDWCKVQAAEFRYRQGIFWGVQYHPEYDLREMARLILAREARLIQQGFFRDHSDVMAYVGKLEELYAHPQRKDLRWQLKIDDDILDDAVRECEFRNFLHTMYPEAFEKGSEE